MGHEAILNSAFARERSLDEAIPDLDNLLRNFHYLTAELPAEIGHLTGATLLQSSSSAAIGLVCPLRQTRLTWFVRTV